MMFKKSTFQMTYIGEIFTKILVLPYVGRELNMVIMLPDENTDLRTVRSADGNAAGGVRRGAAGAASGARLTPFLLLPPRPAPPGALPAPQMVLPGGTVPGLKIFNSLLGGERTHLREIHRVDEAGHAGRRRGRSVPP